MPLKDDVAKYIAQGRDAVSGYVEAYKDKDKHRKEGQEHDHDEKTPGGAQHVMDDKQSATPAATSSPVTVGGTELAAAEEARPSSALAKYKDKLAANLPTGQFDIGEYTVS